MRIYIFRILTMIHLNTFSRVCPHSRGNNATEWDSVRIWRKDLSSTAIIPVEMPDFRTRHPGQVTTVENLSREARTRVRAVVCLYRRPANWPPRLYHYRMWLMWRLTQPLRLVIIIALGNRASPSILNRVPSERNALSTESTWPPGPNAPSSLSLSLSHVLSFSAPFLHRSVDTLVYSFSEPRSGRQVSVIVSRVAGRERRKRRNVSQARLCVDRGLGGSLLVFDEIHRPKDGPHCFISHESVTPRCHGVPTRS